MSECVFKIHCSAVCVSLTVNNLRSKPGKQEVSASLCRWLGHISIHTNGCAQVNCFHEYQCRKLAHSEQTVHVLYLEEALFSSNVFWSWTPVWDSGCSRANWTWLRAAPLAALTQTRTNWFTHTDNLGQETFWQGATSKSDVTQQVDSAAEPP